MKMSVRRFEIERLSVTSSRLFEAVIRSESLTYSRLPW
jgi:hypothetical protein